MAASRAEAGTSLADRLRAAAQVLIPSRTQDSGALLDALVRDLAARPDPARVWLLLACLSLAVPDTAQVRAAERVLRRGTPAEAAVHLLEVALPSAVLLGPARLRVVTGEVLVLVDHTARYDVQTGIQRVLRALVPRWQRDHAVLPVALSPEGLGLRTLAPDEQRRLTHWRPQRAGLDQEATSAHDPSLWEIVVPWQSTVVLGEVPAPEACDRIAALGEVSGNRVTAIGYDCIPVVSSGIVSAGQAERFGAYLSALTHADRVAAISASAAGEFGGFTRMLPSQGLRGPEVHAVVLPTDMGNALVQTPPRRRRDTDSRPLVLCVGRLDPRKNQVALLHAAEQLWREGLAFRLALVAGGGFGPEGQAAVARLQKVGRPITLAQGIADEDLRGFYARARFTVFASLHEGYGLPVAESFALGVPALTTDYGSTAEIAEHGGALLIDPRDDDALREGLRRMLTDDDLLADLRAQITALPQRTWDDYAREAWQVLS